MKTITKLALAAIAFSSIVSAGALADDIRTVERYNNHGGSALVYRQCAPSAQSTSIAVYAQGQGLGNAVSDSASSPRLTLRDNAHGGSRFLYSAE